MKRCIRSQSLVLITILILFGCASSPKGKVVPMEPAFGIEGPKEAPLEAAVPEMHTQPSKSLAAIPSDKEDAAVFYYSLGQAYSLDNDTEKAIEAYRATLVYDPRSALVHARLAAELIKQGSMAEARELCETAIALNPKFIDSYLLLAGIHVATKEYKQALAIYSKALAQEPENRDALLYYGVTLAEVAKYKEAIAKLEKLVKLKEVASSQVDQSVAYFYLAKVQQQAGFRDAAVKTLKIAIEKRPGFVKAAMLLAEIYAAEHQDKLARNVLEEVFRESPDAEIAGHLAEDFLADNKFDKAVVYLETLVEEDPSNENLHLKLGLVYWQLHWLDKAAKVFNDILARHPTSSEILFYTAELELERSGPMAALPYYKRISPDYSKYESAVSRVVSIYRDTKQTVAAQNFLVDVLAKRSDLVAFYPLLAALYEDDNHLSEAREVLELGRKRYPADENIMYYLGFIYDHMGEKDKGITTMETLLVINPNNANALNFLGYTKLERGEDLAQAENYLSRAVSLKPNDAFVLDSYGWLLFKKGQSAKAMKQLERAYAQKPDEAIIIEHLGDVYLALNMREKALDAYKKVYAGNGETSIKERVAVKITNLETAIADGNTRTFRREPAMARPVPVGVVDERAPASDVQ